MKTIQHIITVWLLLQSIAIAQTVQTEYYFDSDPGEGNRVTIEIPEDDTLSILNHIDKSGLSAGFHTVYHSYFVPEQWTPFSGEMFYIPHPINQTLATGEYFFNKDPGVGNGNSISISQSNSIEEVLELNTSGLKPGFHTAYIRVKDSQGKWSVCEGRQLYITDTSTAIVATFSQIDDKATVQIDNSASDFILDKSYEIATDGLEAGLHTLSLKTLDNKGSLSIAETRYFSVTKPAMSVANGEFFIDQDPGIGNGTPLEVPIKDSFELELNIPQTTQVGFHTLYIRYKDNNGMWSTAEGRQFYIKEPYTSAYQPPIVKMEFFLGDDPGTSFAIPTQIEQGDTVETEITVLTNGMLQNTHSVSVRVQDSAGRWSLATPLDFQVFECEIAEKPETPTGDTAICKDNPNTVYKTAGGKWATGYNWSIFPSEAGTLKGTSDSVTVNWNANFSGDAYISVQATNDCYPSPYSDSLKVHVRDITDVPVRPQGVSLICAGSDSVAFTITQAYNADNYSWAIEPESAGIIVGEDSIGYLSLDPDFFGYANVSVQSVNTCFTSEPSQTLIAQVLPPIIESISGETTIYGDKPSAININVSGSSPWDIAIKGEGLDTTFLSESTTIPFEFNQPGIYTVSATESGSCSMKREVEVSSVEILATEVILPQTIGIEIGGTASVDAIILPANTSDKSLTWVSEDTLVATVDQMGNVTPIGIGLTNIYAISPKGDAFGKTVLSVVESVVEVTNLTLPDSIAFVVDQQASIPFEIIPFNATNTNIVWKSSDEAIATVSPTGQVNPLSIGNTTISASMNDGAISVTCNLYVTASLPPATKNLEKIVEVGTELTSLNLKDIISDDSTNFDALDIQILSSNTTTSITDSILNINAGSIVTDQTDSIVVMVTDEDGLSSHTVIVFKIKEAPNQPPVVFEFPESVIQEGDDFSPINLNKRVYDDYTDVQNIQWRIDPESTEHYSFSTVNNVLFIENKIPSWIGTEDFIIIGTDESGLSDTSKLVVGISQKPNEGPSLFPIPVQVQTEEEKLTTIPLYQYIVDDYTQPEFINWSQSKSTKIKLAFDGALAFIDIIDDTWIGQESVWLTASDEEGLTDSVQISFVQEGTVTGKWYTKPKIDFTAEAQVIGAEEEIQMQAKLYGAETWLWQFVGASPNQANTLSPRISYTKPGIYPITLLAENQEFGVDTLTKQSYITVIGIKQSDTLVCYGDEIVIEANAPNLDSYSWNGTEGGISTSFIATADTVIRLEAQSGLFTYKDSIIIRVPQKVELGADQDICSGSTVIFDAGVFVSYIWNDSESDTLQTYSATTTGEYFIEVTDENECTTRDTITLVNELALPTLSLPDTLKTCLEVEVSIDAGDHSSYTWSNGTTESVTNTAEEGYTAITVTGDNGCTNSDSTYIFVQKPFNEQIGIVTVSELNTYVIVAWERSTGKGTESYNVYREETSGFEYKGSVPFNEISVFVDETADFRTRAYKYVITTVDSCGNESAIEDCVPHKTMHLRRSEFQGTFQLEWSAYEGFDFSGYQILEGKDSEEMREVESVPASNLSYSIPNYDAENNYRVAVIVPETVTPTELKSDSGPYSQSMSNLSEAIIENAIGANNITISVLPNPTNGAVTINAIGYSMSKATVEVFNNAGTQVFSQPVIFDLNGNANINLSDKPPGNYTLQVVLNEQTVTVPIILVK